MNVLSHIKAITRLALPAALLGALSLPSWALIEYSDSQRETIVEMIEQLEERHYSKLEYDDTLSSQHLDSYIDSLDRGKMFFTAADLAEFEQYRTVMDEQLAEGKLDAGPSLEARLKSGVRDSESTPIPLKGLGLTGFDWGNFRDHPIKVDTAPNIFLLIFRIWALNGRP